MYVTIRQGFSKGGCDAATIAQLTWLRFVSDVVIMGIRGRHKVRDLAFMNIFLDHINLIQYDLAQFWRRRHT